MHILVAVIGIFAAAAFWWYRLKYMSDAANEVADAVGKVRGNMRRNKLRKKAAIAPVAVIDHPVTAAATVVMAIAAEDRPVTDIIETRVREQIALIAGSDKQLDEAIAYAKWASDQVADVPTVIDKTAEFLKPHLDEIEKEQLLSMVFAATREAERHAMFRERTGRLRRKLGLETVH